MVKEFGRYNQMTKQELLAIVERAERLGITFEEFTQIYKSELNASDNKGATEIYLVRHAPTPFNGENEKIRSVLDLSLDEKGLMLANKTGIELRNANIDCIYSSELLRAQQTSKAIYLNGAKKIELLRDLNSWNLGNLVGQLADKKADQTQNLVDNPDQLPPGSNESFNIFKERTIKGYNEAIQFPGIIAIVSHYSNCRIILEYLNKDCCEMQPGGFIKIK